MSGFVQEFGFVYGGGSVTSRQFTFPTTVPVGDALVVSLITTGSSGSELPVAAVDSKGNMWHHLHLKLTTGTNTVTHVLYVNITQALTASDTVTFTFSGNITRLAVSCAQFNEVLTPDVHADADNGGVSWSVLATDVTAPVAAAEELVYGAWGLTNSGRTFTATHDFTALTKYTSDAGSGDRAIVSEYKYVNSLDVTTYTANGTLNSNGIAAGIVQTFTVTSLPARSGRPKVWNGTSWESHDAKIWNGTSWEIHKAKGYSASTWVESK